MKFFKTEIQMWGEVEQSQFLWNLIYENLSKKNCHVINWIKTFEREQVNRLL